MEGLVAIFPEIFGKVEIVMLHHHYIMILETRVIKFVHMGKINQNQRVVFLVYLRVLLPRWIVIVTIEKYHPVFHPLTAKWP